MKKQKLKVLSVGILSAFYLAACNSGTTTPNPNATQVAVAAKPTANLKADADVFDQNVSFGQGIMSSTYVATPAIAVTPADKDNPPKLIGDQRAAMVTFTKATNTQVTMANLGLSGSINGKISDYTGSLSGKYKDLTKDSNTSISADYTAIAAAEYSYADPAHELVMLANGQELYKTDKDEFYRQYGDSFINSVRAGIAVFANVKFVFEDSTAKNEIAAKVNFAGDPVTIAGQIDKLNSKTSNKVKVEVYISQFGGDIEQAGQVFKNNGATAAPDSKDIYIFNCSLDNFTACDNFLKNVNNYIADDSNNGFGGQIRKYLKTGSVTTDDVAKLYRFGPAATNTDSLGVARAGTEAVISYKSTPYSVLKTEQQIAPFTFSNDTLQIQRDLAASYKTATSNQILLSKYHDLLSTAPLSFLGEEAENYFTNMDSFLNTYNIFIDNNFTDNSAIISACYTPSLQAEATCSSAYAKFSKDRAALETEFAKYNRYYSSTSIRDEGKRFYLLPATGDELPNAFVAWSNKPGSYTPLGTIYYVDPETGSLIGAAAPEQYSGEYADKYIFQSKAGAKCTVSKSKISCTTSSILDVNTLQAYTINAEDGQAADIKTPGLFIGGVFNLLTANNPLLNQ